MPKLLNVEFSAITDILSVTGTSVENVTNVTYKNDGQNLLVGGNFIGYNQYVNQIVKIFSGGSQDTSFDMGDGFYSTTTVFPEIFSIAIDSNGDYYVGGLFDKYKNQSRNNIVKIKSNGDIDDTFNVGTGFNGEVRKIKILSDGKILVGGNFSTYNSLTSWILVKLNVDGTIDSTFNQPTTNFGSIYDIITNSSDSIYLGGDFITYSGVAAQYIVKLNSNGTIDNSFSSFSGFNGTVTKILLDSSENLYVGGSFTSYSGVSANRIIKLLPTGEKDISFDNSTGFNTGTVNDMDIDSLNKIYAVGTFTSYKGTSAVYMIKLNTDGSKDITFNNTSKFSTNNGTLRSVRIDPTGSIYFGGYFTTFGVTFVNNIIKLDSSGNLDGSFNFYGKMGYANAFVNTIQIDSNNDIIIGGKFFAYKQPSQLVSISTFNAAKNNSFDPNYGLSVSVSLNTQSVRGLLKSSSNKFYVSGYFENYSLYNGNYRAIALLGLNNDGSPDATINVNTGGNGPISRIFQDSLGGIYLTGQFTSYKSVAVPRIVKINSDASIDNTFSRSGFQSTNDMVIDFDTSNNLYVGGSFTTFSSQTNNYIIKILPNGFKDTSFDNTTGFNNFVSDVKVDLNGKILVGGGFTSYKGNTENGIIRLNPDGSKDTTFDNSTGFNSNVSSIVLWGDKIYVCGPFTTYKNVQARNIIRLNYDGSIDTTFNYNIGFSSQPVGILCDTFGNIYTYGDSQRYQNYENSRIYKIKPNGVKDPLFYIPSKYFLYGNGLNSFTNQVRNIIFI